MKSLFFTAGIILLLLSGCGSDNDTIVEDNIQDPVAVTENLIALDPSLKISAENIAVFNLEHHGADVNADDTATPGTDCYTYLNDEAIQTVLSVDNDNSIGSLFITNKVTNETTTVLSGETSIPFEISANTEYKVCVVHNGVSAEMQTVFIRFIDSESLSVASSAISSTDQQPVAYSSDDLKKLLATGECNRCDLEGADLSNAHLDNAKLTFAKLNYANLNHANLNHANLEGANLNYAHLYNANLTFADLNYVNLNQANLDGANLDGANLNYDNLIAANLTAANLTAANLTAANLLRANLSGADLSGANLSGADLTAADLSGADLIAADLDGADFSYATWTDGTTICKKDSIGECKK